MTSVQFARYSPAQHFHRQFVTTHLFIGKHPPVSGQQFTRLFSVALYLLLSGCVTPTRNVPVQKQESPSASATAPTPLAPRPVKAQAEQPKVAELLGKVNFVVAGDIMAHTAVLKAATAQGGFESLYAPVKNIVSSADLAFGNLETPIAPKVNHGSREFVFNAPPEMLAAVKNTGFGVVLFANNHVYDQDRDGFVESLNELDKSGLKYLGAGRTLAEAQAPLRLEVHGVKLAWFGAAQFFNDPKNVTDPKEPAANLLDAAAMSAAIAAVRPEVDAVLVSLHWGVEYQPAPRQSDIDIAHQLFEAGADVIIGSHPHILQPIEVYQAQDGRTCLCLYSLGNFISNQSRLYLPHASADKVGDTRDGVLVRFTLEKRDYGKAGTAVNLANVSYVPLWTDNNFFRTKDELINIHPVVVDLELARVRDEITQVETEIGANKPTKAQTKALIALKQRADLLMLRRTRILSRLGEDFSGDP
jgi:poly-gamma-glutamate synthesis protein (capsule biosynthesis protein)